MRKQEGRNIKPREDVGKKSRGIEEIGGGERDSRNHKRDGGRDWGNESTNVKEGRKI